MQPTTLLIGDYIVVGLSRYQNICKKYFKSPKTVNCGIPGDKTQHVLWRAVKLLVIRCGTNNLNYNDPIDIAKGILNIGKSLLEEAPKSNKILTGILLRDKYKSKRRNKFCEVSSYLNSSCKTEFIYIWIKVIDGSWIAICLTNQRCYKDLLQRSLAFNIIWEP